MVECIECGADIKIPGTPRKGDKVRCGECREEFTIVDDDPVELEYADTDWVDDDEDYGDDEDDLNF